MQTRSTLVALMLIVGVSLSAEQVSPKLRPDLAKATAVGMRFDNASVADALQTLGNFAGVTIQIAPEVKDTLNKTKFITVRFHNTTFEDTLLTMVRYAGLSYRVIDEKTVLVTAPDK